MTTQSGRSKTGGLFTVIELAVTGARRKNGPMRRAQPLDASALLIYQHRRIPADNIAERLNQPRGLLRRTHVPLEDYQAPRPRIAEKSALTGGNL
jgi:hypothetical protein